MRNKKIAIGIPTISEFEYLNESLNMIYDILPNIDIYIYNNSHINLLTKLDIKNNVKILGSGFNIGVAGAWNTMLSDMKSNGYQYALMLNDDIKLSKDIVKIYEYVSDGQPKFARILNDWSVFLIHLDIYNKVGIFDENFFPAYFEDCDYNYRLKIAEVNTDFPKFLIPEVYRTSSSITTNPNLNKNYNQNRLYYINKWGGEPSFEIFIHPFNNNKS
jgi:GT2 family glycosyltransferase